MNRIVYLGIRPKGLTTEVSTLPKIDDESNLVLWIAHAMSKVMWNLLTFPLTLFLYLIGIRRETRCLLLNTQ